MKPETKDTIRKWYQLSRYSYGPFFGFVLGFLVANRIPESYKQSILLTALAIAVFPLCVDCFLAGLQGKLLFDNKHDKKDI